MPPTRPLTTPLTHHLLPAPKPFRPQCARCFHSPPRRSAEQSTTNPTNTTNPRTRHQRAAAISDEVRHLSRPETENNRETGPSQAPDTSSNPPAPLAYVGEGAMPGGSLGDNEGVGREGPLAQGAGVGAPSTLLSDEDARGRVSGDNSVVRAAGEGNAGAVLEPVAPASSTASSPATTTTAATTPTKPNSTRKPSSAPRLPLPGPPFHPSTLTQAFLASATAGATSTIAASNFASVLLDRLHTLTSPGHLPSASRPSAPALARKLLAGHIVRFASQGEKARVLEACNSITGRGSGMTDQERAAKGPDTEQPYFKPLPESVRGNLIEAVVRGGYDEEGLLAGGGKYKQQPVLDEISRVLGRNGSYTGQDGERVVRKVRGLLPVGGLARGKGAGVGK
ncbi:hypothetical protein LTR08_006245 [Meristemomyces frigidus]|nr:hypothetical protein LTR08_006245 [Meristemomyces frigidus]